MHCRASAGGPRSRAAACLQTVTLSQLDSLRRELIVSSRVGYRYVIFGKVRSALHLLRFYYFNIIIALNDRKPP